MGGNFRYELNLLKLKIMRKKKQVKDYKKKRHLLVTGDYY